MNEENGRSFRLNGATLLAAAIIVSIIVSYLRLNLIYNVEDVDDAWSLSFIYNALVRHLPPDASFGGGLADLRFFGTTQAYVYAGFLDLFGWTKYNAHLLSALFMVLSALAWYGILTRLRFSRKLSFFFALLVLWCEPFFREAVLSRPESMTFFLVSAGFFFLVRQWYFAAALLGVIAVENHPMGVMFFVYALAWVASVWRPRASLDRRLAARNGLKFTAGLLCGAAYFLALHYQSLAHTLQLVAKGVGMLEGTVLSQYFFVSVNYYRHLLDFVFFAGCIIVYFLKGYYRENRFVFVFLCIIVAVNFVNPHANHHYALYYYPALLLTALYVFERNKRLEWAVTFLFLIFLAYNASVFFRKRHYDFGEYVRQIQASVPADSLPVVGSPNEWFAFKDRRFYPAVCTFLYDSTAPEFYLIAGNDYHNGIPGAHPKVLFRDCIEPRYSRTVLTTVSVNNETFSVLLMKKK